MLTYYSNPPGLKPVDTHEVGSASGTEAGNTFMHWTILTDTNCAERLVCNGQANIIPSGTLLLRLNKVSSLTLSKANTGHQLLMQRVLVTKLHCHSFEGADPSLTNQIQCSDVGLTL